MLPISIIPVGLIVLALAACGVAGNSGSPQVQNPAHRCALAMTEQGGQVQISAQAMGPISGRYALTIAQTGQGGQNLINQAGDFSAAPGQVVTLGTASVSGSVAQFDAALTLDTGGATLHCPITDIGL
jgi:hypothetical protein